MRFKRWCIVAFSMLWLVFGGEAPSPSAVHEEPDMIGVIARNLTLGHYWTATLEMTTSHPRTVSDQGFRGQAGKDDRVTDALFKYLVYQNPDGMVRQELVSSPPTGDSVGVGRDVAIYDYKNGSVVAFDRARPLAVRYQLDDIDRNPFLPEAADWGWRDILGYRCRGAENRVHFPRTTLIAIRQTWVAVGIGFKDPLLDTRMYVQPDGEETYTATRAISDLRRVRWLSPSHFRVPARYEINDIDPQPNTLEMYYSRANQMLACEVTLEAPPTMQGGH